MQRRRYFLHHSLWMVSILISLITILLGLHFSLSKNITMKKNHITLLNKELESLPIVNITKTLPFTEKNSQRTNNISSLKKIT